MEKRDIALIEASFLRIARNRDDFASAFYQTLVSENPELRPFFANSDMDSQKRKLLLALATIVEVMYEGEKLRRNLRQIAEIHKHMQLERSHYERFRDSFIHTIAAFINEAWSSETEKAWRTAFDEMIDIMLEN